MTRPLAISIRKASQLSGLRQKTIIAELEAGRLSGRRVGGEWIVFLDSLERLLHEDVPGPAPKLDRRVRAALKSAGVL